MPCTYLDPSDRNWEPLQGTKPNVRLSEHPARGEVVLQASLWQGTDVDRAGVWDVATRRLLWAPEGANAMAWTSGGDRLLVLVESHLPGPHDRGITVTPLQSEFTHRCDLYEWPSRRRLSWTALDFPTGWLIDVVPSPVAALAAYVWLDQTEAGVELVTWDDDRLVQLEERGYFGEDTNLLTGPVFSPDGRHLILAYGESRWWADERDEPSPGGMRRAGGVVILDTRTGDVDERDAECLVEPGWVPDDPYSVRSEMLSVPRFVSDDAFVVETPNGRTVTFWIGPGS